VEALTMALAGEWSSRELKDWIDEQKGKTVSRVAVFSGQAVVSAQGDHWQIGVEAGRAWPDGDGIHTCDVTVRQILATEGAKGPE
jgi:hypothetical protein